MPVMCLLVLAWMKHPRYRLVVAANRDEFHERPAAPLAWWGDGVAMLSGRDLAAGGTWTGVDRAGRFGAVTNFREPNQAASPGTPSRGMLVPRFLAGDMAPADFIERLGESAAEFAGFNLIVGGSRSLLYFSNRSADVPRQLQPGVYGLSNHELDSPWPKLTRARERLAAEIDRSGEPEVAALFDLLADRRPADDQVLPGKGLPEDLERAISAPFVQHPRYGTRCSTVLLAGHDGRVVTAERRFDAAGRLTGATRIEFAIYEPR
ncbi:MAG: NRDE family protein [Steroidobacteraceae bacterium]|nr:NRDE family protein [Steroidobacteraceae bacterium]